MIDINLFRVDKGGNPDAIKESQRKRGASVELVDDIVQQDRAWVKCKALCTQAHTGYAHMNRPI